MKKVLVYFTQFGSALGGGEFTPLAFISELQKSCKVTLALNWRSDVSRAAETLGIPLDMSLLDVVYVKPRNSLLRRLDAVFPVCRTWKLKKLAKKADLCISTANMADFGRPAHHFVYLLRHFGDNAFCDRLAGRPALRGTARLRRKLRTALAEYFLRPLLGVRSSRKILADPREKIYPTSHYVEKIMRDFYGDFNSTVFYPPTIWEPSLPAPARDPLKVVSLGQLFPEKRLMEIVALVERARELSGLDLKLSLAGPLGATPYVGKLQAAAAEKSWLTLPGPMYGSEKERFLRSASYAVHAERDEAFGISVTEYLKSGLVPVVPDEGGTCEIAGTPALCWHTVEEGAKILARLASDAGFGKEQRQFCAERAELFTRQVYEKNQHALLAGILDSIGEDRHP
ncbi:MAG: glycosyltransferase [Lentisphaeria bacterium]|nr:glycosyltransferase [Lentisphaeria bacterium]